MVKKYTKDSIRTTEKLEHVRLRPNGYIADRYTDGQYHISRELLDNSIDELIMLLKEGLLQLTVFDDKERGTYQVLISDNGRGIPVDRLENSFTVLNTSGKFDSNSYTFSSGSFGVGGKATAGLSEHFKAVSFRGERIGSLYVSKGETISSEIAEHKTEFTGVRIAYEPDSQIFSDKKDFVKVAIPRWTHLFETLNMYVDFRAVIKVVDKGIPPSFWTAGIDDSIKMLVDLEQQGTKVYDSTIYTKDKDLYVKEHFGIERSFSWSHAIEQDIVTSPNKEKESGYDKIRFFLNLYTVKGGEGGHVSMANYIMVPSNDSQHLTTIHRVMKKYIAQFIKDKSIKDFFLKKYHLPIYILAFIQFDEIKYDNMHKTGIVDGDFRKLFGKILGDHFAQNTEALKDLYSTIENDIEEKFAKYNDVFIEVKDNRRLLLDLKFPEKFKDCSTNDRSKAELFLSEGDSAGSPQGRNSKYQAIYALRGVPFSALSRTDDIEKARRSLIMKDISSDIIKIMGVTSNMEDFSKLRYGKVFIMVDADSAGAHIASILFTNFWVINPRLITEGIVQLVTTPLYELRIKQNKKISSIYKRTPDEVTNALSEYIYHKAFDIKLRTRQGIQELSKKDFIEFCRLVFYIGRLIEDISEEHHVPPLLLEMLIPVLEENPDLNRLTAEKVKQALGISAVEYDPIPQILNITIGRNDIVLVLKGLQKSINMELLPMLKRIAYKEYQILLTTKYTDLFKDEPVSYVKLWKMFGTLKDHFFTIKRHKGLAGLKPEDRAKLCMDPEYRVTTNIRSIGDAKRIIEIMGKDSKYRKELLFTDIENRMTN